ncbi:hypothetical protein BHC46_01135 [Snodgrassella alvi]|jgi:hypothetical protein|uniref:Uncharacterized protein n=1 Tax=Snodgrassella alvi TaxID=1196083 RepID=A0A2N9XPN4_9NEIS|nr:hypothetical protein BGI31_10765 [Snodgrassella communis]PIT50289.1 hypothetical protein BHC46_01135 [Snodgrassella alvi]
MVIKKAHGSGLSGNGRWAAIQFININTGVIMTSVANLINDNSLKIGDIRGCYMCLQSASETYM